MKILLIAPTQSNSHVPRLETLPEIRAIVSNHNTTLLIENLTKQDIYDSVRNSSYDVIHFAGHTIDNKLFINDQESLNKEECAQIARTANAKLVFFNGCDSAGLASYCVRHSIEFAIFTTARLEDRIAWQMPSTFYTLLSRPDQSLAAAYVQADGGDGLYGLLIAPDHVADQRIIRRDVDQLILTSAKFSKRIAYSYYLNIVVIVVYLLGIYYGR